MIYERMFCRQKGHFIWMGLGLVGEVLVFELDLGLLGLWLLLLFVGRGVLGLGLAVGRV